MNDTTIENTSTPIVIEPISLGEELYVTSLISLGSIIDEKAKLVQDMITLYSTITRKFKNNPYMVEALAYIQDYFSKFLHMIDDEYALVMAILEYLRSIDLAQLDNVSEDNIRIILKTVSDSQSKRLVATNSFINNYTKLTSEGILTKNNYYYNKIDEETLDAEKKEQLLKLITK